MTALELVRGSTRHCKICGGTAAEQFRLPKSKKSGHPIPDEADDCPFYVCTQCDFCFTDLLDDADHTAIYDEEYWTVQDGDLYGRVDETLRLVAFAAQFHGKPLDRLSILDYGCGSGAFVETGRKKLGLDVWGTDIIAPKFGRDHFLPSLGDRRFDIVIACEVIEHLPQPMETFRTIRKHLKHPGVFAFQTARWNSRKLDRSWWYLGPGNGHVSHYSTKSLHHAFRQLGGAEQRLWNGYSGVQAWLFGERRSTAARLIERLGALPGRLFG